MAVNHRITGLVFAFGVGLIASYWSYMWITNSERAAERAVEEAVVMESREILRTFVSSGELIHYSDALDRVREAGKVYIYPTSSGWELSGQYQRDGVPTWHPFLMQLDHDTKLVSLSVRDPDPATAARAREDRRVTVTPR
jgi:hypothetical protein